MAILTGDGFHITSALGGAGAAANGTVLSADDLGSVVSIQTNANLVAGTTVMHVGDGVVVDTDADGDFADEIATTQADNDRYVNSTVTYADGSTSNATLELVTLSDGTQVILLRDDSANLINAASDQIESITLGTFNNANEDRYLQTRYSNDITNSVVCFCEKTLIQTPTGERMIRTLATGDEIVTAHDGERKIVWVGKRTLSSAQLIASPHLRPVLIRASALGPGVPRTDLRVSPQHRILIVSKIAERMFGQREIFVPAIKLVETDGIEQVASLAPVTYVHVLLDEHQIIFANGAPTESLYIGCQALKALSDEARNEIFEIFPELKTTDKTVPLARTSIQKKALVNKLLSRHQCNRKPLVLMEKSVNNR